jgi:putative holliday junction resolvase
MPDPARGGFTLMAFDFGEKRIGVAIGNVISGGARPLAVIEHERKDARFAAIEALIKEWGPDRLVVGLPVYPNGEAHPFADRCRRFANQLAGRFGLPVSLEDERYTSALAPKPDIMIDAQAAAILLQGVLDTLSAHGTVSSN